MTTKGTDWTTSIYRWISIAVVAGSALYAFNNLEARVALSDMRIQYHSAEIASIQVSVQELNKVLQSIDKKLEVLIDRDKRSNQNDSHNQE